MDYQEKSNKVIFAIQESSIGLKDNENIRLYLSKSNGLDIFESSEVEEVLFKLEKEDGVIKILERPYELWGPTPSVQKNPFEGLPTHSYFLISVSKKFYLRYKAIVLEDKNLTLNFNPHLNELIINGIVVELKKPFWIEIIKRLFIKGNPTNRELSYGDIYRKIEGMSDEQWLKKSKSKPYQTCKSINRKVHEKANLIDLLKCNFTSVRINPKYL